MCDALDITRDRDNGKDLTTSISDLWFADDGFRPERIAVTPRIGIKKAVEEPLRFVVAGNAYVSGKRAWSEDCAVMLSGRGRNATRAESKYP